MSRTFQGARVLVVDANESVRRITSDRLRELGYEVREAGSAEGALALAQQMPPEVILLDPALRAPKGSDRTVVGENSLGGMELCAALRNITNLQAVAVILTSPRAIHERAMRATGAVDGLRKPFSPDALEAVVAHVLRGPDTAPVDVVEAFEAGLEAEAERREAASAALRVSLEHLAKREAELSATELVAEVEDLAARLPGRERGVSFEGRLEDLALGDVLQLLQLQGQTGVLRVRSDEGRAVALCLRKGAVDLVLAHGAPPEFLFGAYLVREELLEQTELDELLEAVAQRRARTASGNSMPRALLGERLIKLGYINREDRERVLARQSCELIYEALRWTAGRFAFVRNATRPEAEIALELPITSLLMEGLRRVDEWRLIEQQVGDFAMVPVVDALLLARTPRQRLSDEERSVLDAIDGERDVRAIVETSKLGTFEACKVLYQLLTSRLVRAS